MKLWIVRNDGGTLELHRNKPSVSKVTEKPVWISDGFVAFIYKDLFPEVTFKNSPQEIELKLI